ncbi:hypothetical protein FQN54_003189 [Arachnomyces sp. PD_36]|nr:hypothetical protein FQN54_003189 [Arachnomyces sp. PD_36]
MMLDDPEYDELEELVDEENDEENNENKGSYVYKPSGGPNSETERPSKRRKVSKPKSSGDDEPLPLAHLLLDGEESIDSVKLRYATYQHFWSKQEKEIQKILHNADEKIRQEITDFIVTVSPESCDGRVPTGLITVGPNVSSLVRLLQRLNQHLNIEKPGNHVVVLESGDAPNLKTALKNIIRIAITATEGNDGYQASLKDTKGPRMLPYDLELLHRFVKRNKLQNVIIAFRDSEAFDPAILADLVSLLHSWLDRVPFMLLFGIATSADLFEKRLSRSTVGQLQGRRFEVQDSEDSIDLIFQMTQKGPHRPTLWLGHTLSNALLEKSKDYFQSPESFGRGVKYAYMSHFFANPLTILLSDSPLPKEPQPEFCEAIRNLPSFRRYCERLLDDNAPKKVHRLLNDDGYLVQESKKNVQVGQDRMNNLFRSVDVILTVISAVKLPKSVSRQDLSLRALSGELVDSNIFQDILTAIKKMDSDVFQDVFDTLPIELADSEELVSLREELQELLKNKEGTEPLRSEYDDKRSTVQTAVIGRRVKLNKGKKELSKEDVEYTNIINHLHDISKAYFTDSFVNPRELFMNEVFLYDLKNPVKDVFNPKPRYAIERALSSPFDYLVSNSGEASGPSSLQPTTAILYQLYLDSGALVNVYDLWRAFNTMMGGEDEEDSDERMVLVHFSRALSELKAMGMVKFSRKKVDHITKSAWKGL